MGKDRQAGITRRQAVAGLGAAAAAGTASAPARAASGAGEELTWLPAWRIRELIVARKVSALEVTDHFLARIARLEPRLHMFRGLDAEGAREQARAADRALAAGAAPGPLHGVPTALKEHVPAKGLPYGNPMDANYQPRIARRDSITAERLRTAGAVIVGSTVMPGMGTGAGMPDLARHPRNPWNTDRVPGSSSAGSAAAVASGCLPFAIGSDGGGSTRLPASFTGLIGLHTTFGRVPELDLEHRQLNFFSTIDPLTRDARDTALVLKVIAGPDGRAMLSSVLPPAPDYLTELDRGAAGAKLLWMDHLGFAASYATAETPRVAAVARQAAQGFAALGATVAPGKGQWSEPRAYSSMLNGTYSGQPMTRRPSDEELLASLDMREKMRSEFAALLARYDAIALPTALTTAPTLADWDAGWRDMGGYSRAYTANTLMFNFLALPAISIPVGFLDGMPVGLQLVGLPDSEPKLLRLANAYLKKYPRTERPNLA